MARLPELPARRVLTVLFRAGFTEVRRSGSHRFLAHPDGRTMVFALHHAERVGPKLLAKLLKDAKMRPEEFRHLL